MADWEVIESEVKKPPPAVKEKPKNKDSSRKDVDGKKSPLLPPSSQITALAGVLQKGPAKSNKVSSLTIMQEMI